MKYLISYKINLNAEYIELEKNMGLKNDKFTYSVNRQYPILNEITSD